MIRAALLSLCLAGSAAAQDAGAAAQAAAVDLEAAAIQLDAAEDARDRVAALTQTVQAFEAGLTAMRDGLRNVTIRELELSRKLHAQEAEVAQLLGALQSIGTSADTETLIHPAGALASARAGMLVASLTPALTARTAVLKADLTEVSTLRQLQQNAAERLAKGLQGVQKARTELSQAMADRTDLPRRFTADPVRTALLIAATETLEGFASGLSELTDTPIAPDDASIATRKGRLSLPVQGQILRRAGEADAAGVERPGIVVATRPQALVTTPTAATIRYRGPLLDYGLVVLLEPQADMLIVLAGLDTVFGEIGEVLPEGSPVGLMGGEPPGLQAAVSQSGERAGTARPETLYIEVRQGDGPVDPMDWFTTDKG